MKLLIVPLAILVIFYLSSLNWRRSVKAVLFLVVTEGALRKWVLPQASDMIYFLKDLIILGAYLRFYCFSDYDKKIQIKNGVITILIILVTLWCFFQAFNPSLGSLLVGLFGLKGYILYIPFIWMIPTLFQSQEELYKFLRFHLLLVIPIGILGIAQFFSPAASPLNVYTPGQVTQAATFGEEANVRVTGTFSYIGGYGVYLLVCFGLLIPFLALKQSLWWRWVSIIEILLVIVNSFMTGSRSVVFALLLFLLGFIGIKGLTQPVNTFRLLRQFSIPTIVVVIAASIWFKPAIDAFWLRTTSADDVPGRIEGTFNQPLDFIKYKELDGYGTGSTHPGGKALRKALNLPDGEVIPTYYEEEPGRIMLELGPIGFLLWYGLRISILIAMLLVFWKLQRPFLRHLVLAAFLIQAIQIKDQLVSQHTFLVYYWFLSSFVFLMPQLEQIENWHQEQLLQQHNVSSTYFADSPYR